MHDEVVRDLVELLLRHPGLRQVLEDPGGDGVGGAQYGDFRALLDGDGVVVDVVNHLFLFFPCTGGDGGKVELLWPVSVGEGEVA